VGVVVSGLRRVRVRVPLRVEFSGTRFREATLIEGPAGWGEVSPFPDYPCDPEVAEAAALEAATTAWPEPVRDRIRVAAAIPAVEPERAAQLAVAATLGWLAPVTVKVKVGAGDDEGRVAAVREALGHDARIRVDANGRWDLDTAIHRLGRLGRYDLEFAEQPVASLEDLAVLRRRVDVPVAADEAVQAIVDAKRLAALAAADVLVIKVQTAGGVAAGLAIAEAGGVPVVVSSLVETSVGLAAGLALAASLPGRPLASGLGTGALLAGDVVADPLVPVAGSIAVRRPVPDPELLARWAVQPG
jgi:O-succinylbenzoate synthase